MRFRVGAGLLPPAALNLRQGGHQAGHIRDVGFRGRPGREATERVQDHQAVLVTRDMGFANTLTFPLLWGRTGHCGVAFSERGV
ncbi:MAG: DUF5615 family PIN-like protein [Firmicutes bacterium]|nr:DUF5615 family PIN-like protein [Candidatus Fermentithermobacillaceae bacterium]